MGNKIQKGFTLIELLIVIVILGILAAGVVIAINPKKRMDQANDTKVKNDVGQIATGMQAYFTIMGYYTATPAKLVTSGDLKMVPAPPSGYLPAAYTVVGTACGLLDQCTDVAVGGTIKAPVTVGNAYWCWKSSTGITSEVAAQTDCTP